MKEPCPERRILSSRVAAAIQAVYQVRKTAVGEQSALLLHDAREAERKAERELRAHIEEHGCKL